MKPVSLILLAFIAIHQARALPDSLEIELFLRKNRHPAVRAIMENPEAYRLEIIYSRKKKTGQIERNSYRREAEYYYPASLLKLPMALLALEWLERQGYSRQARLQALLSDGRSCDESFSHIIEKMLVHSDNQSYDCLYALMGYRQMHLHLHSSGFEKIHLARPFLGKIDSAWKVIEVGRDPLQGQSQSAPTIRQTAPPDSKVGIANILNGKRFNAPRDFSSDNYFPLSDAHSMLEELNWPESRTKFFQISKSARQWLLMRLKMLPGQSKIKIKEWRCNTYQKFFFRSRSCKPLPRGIQVAGKGGMAYGFLADSSIIIDKNRNCQFLLSATVYVNANQVLGDNSYEYETLGWPFLYGIGQAFLEQACPTPAE